MKTIKRTNANGEEVTYEYTHIGGVPAKQYHADYMRRQYVPKKTPITQEQQQPIIKLRQAGTSLKKISEQTDVSVWKVRQILKNT